MKTGKVKILIEYAKHIYNLLERAKTSRTHGRYIKMGLINAYINDIENSDKSTQEKQYAIKKLDGVINRAEIWLHEIATGNWKE